MQYIMKAGALHRQQELLAYIKGGLAGPERKIFSANGDLLLQTDVRRPDAPPEGSEVLQTHQYLLLDVQGDSRAVADPHCSAAESAAISRVDCAQIQLDGNAYRLMMKDNCNYRLENGAGETILQISHRGLTGGWNVDAAAEFPPEIICGMFVFCRYIEQENEFRIV